MGQTLFQILDRHRQLIPSCKLPSSNQSLTIAGPAFPVRETGVGLVAYFSSSFSSEQRGALRRTLRLKVDVGREDGSAVPLIIHDLSATGLLVQTGDGPSIGEKLHIELPDAGLHPAKVVWSSGSFVGCRFDQPLPQATISAALLRSIQPRLARTTDASASSPARDLQARVEYLEHELGKASKAETAYERQIVSNDNRLPLHVRGQILLGLSAFSAGTWALLLWSMGLS